MSGPKHGTYDPDHGFYDSSLKGWIKDPAKLTETRSVAPGGESQREQVARWLHKPFKPVSELEGMLRLRDSDRPEDRANYERLAAGSRRIQVTDYETKRSEAIKAGEWQPPTA